MAVVLYPGPKEEKKKKGKKETGVYEVCLCTTE